MQLQKAEAIFSKSPNAEALLVKLHHEYELMSKKLAEYYVARRKLIQLRSQALKQSIERLELDFKLKEIKQAFVLQKEKWQALTTLTPSLA